MKLEDPILEIRRAIAKALSPDFSSTLAKQVTDDIVDNLPDEFRQTLYTSMVLFDVNDETGGVSLCCGPVSVKVAESPDEFADFRDAALRKLNSINDEIVEDYVQ